MSELIQHSCESVEWYTPSPFVEAARTVMGSIEFDPFSSDSANETVRAQRYLTAEQDGFAKRWLAETTWINPPGGLITSPKSNNALQRRAVYIRQTYKTKSVAAAAYARAVDAWEARELGRVVFLGFTLEILRTTQGTGRRDPLTFPLCIPRDRIAFEDAFGEAQSHPAHANVLIYMPDPANWNADVDRWCVEMRQFGAVSRGVR